jgi:hypothetical protein
MNILKQVQELQDKIEDICSIFYLNDYFIGMRIEGDVVEAVLKEKGCCGVCDYIYHEVISAELIDTPIKKIREAEKKRRETENKQRLHNERVKKRAQEKMKERKERELLITLKSKYE